MGKNAPRGLRLCKSISGDASKNSQNTKPTTSRFPLIKYYKKTKGNFDKMIFFLFNNIQF